MARTSPPGSGEGAWARVPSLGAPRPVLVPREGARPPPPPPSLLRSTPSSLGSLCTFEPLQATLWCQSHAAAAGTSHPRLTRLLERCLINKLLSGFFELTKSPWGCCWSGGAGCVCPRAGSDSNRHKLTRSLAFRSSDWLGCREVLLGFRRIFQGSSVFWGFFCFTKKKIRFESILSGGFGLI